MSVRVVSESRDSCGNCACSLRDSALRPATSESMKPRRFPTSAGSTCSNERGTLLTPSMCMPPLCANASRPTYGSLSSGARFAMSAASSALSLSVESLSALTAVSPILSSRLGITDVSRALPHRSPNPSNVPCTCRAPARTAVSVLATASSPSLCACMPTVTAVRPHTSVTAASTSQGSAPPFVSQSARHAAPRPRRPREPPARTPGCSGIRRRKCSASNMTSRPRSLKKPTVSRIICRFSSSVAPAHRHMQIPCLANIGESAGVLRRQKRQHAGVVVGPGLLAARWRRMPSATVFKRQSGRGSKKARSFDLEADFQPRYSPYPVVQHRHHFQLIAAGKT